MTSQIDLPISIVSEIIKNHLDDDVLLSKNTKIAFSRIGGVFILYLTNLASEICKSKNKSKITVKDILDAMEKAGFENFKPEIENLLMDIDKQTPPVRNKRKNEEEEISIPEAGGKREITK